MKKMMKKAENGDMAPKKPMSKKPMSKKPMPTKMPAKKKPSIITDEVTDEGYLKLGPRKETPGGGFSRNGSMMKKAMMGTGMHKMPDGSMMKNSMMKMGGAMAKQAAVAIAMKKAGKSPKKKMGYGGEAASMVPPAMMKKGGAMKKCKYGCK